MCRSRIDRIVEVFLGAAAMLAGGIVLLIIGFLFYGASPVLQSGEFPSLFTDREWQPTSDRDPQFGIVPMLVGSVLVTVLAGSIAVPLGVAGAVFHQFYLPSLFKKWNRRALELLAGVPSVVFGFWGLMVLVPAINRMHPPGQSLLAAGLVLGLMILPMVALTSQVALDSVPREHLQAAAGLGIGRASTILRIALPCARPGIGAGAVLAIARAVGETMAVVMVCGNIANLPGSIFDPIRPITSTIVLEMGYATESHKALLYAAGLILVLVIAALAGWLAFHRNPEAVAK